MSELRKNHITTGWNIIASERGKRPNDYRRQPDKKEESDCPFCEGHEQETPLEVFALRTDGSQPNKPGWRVRVVPNKFPALSLEGKAVLKQEGLFNWIPGVGRHEVVVDTPRHDGFINKLSDEELKDVLITLKLRILDAQKDPGLKYVQIFKNYGPEAGASRIHPHTQLIALPVVPQTIRDELLTAYEYFQETEHCLFCDTIQQEKEKKLRIVSENDAFICFAPFSSRVPFELHILPVSHYANYEHTDEEELFSLAQILKSTITTLKKVLKDPPYNLLIHTAPHCAVAKIDPKVACNCYHWHIEILPVLTRIAGFELGTGMFINPTPPEIAAKYLRESNENSTI